MADETTPIPAETGFSKEYVQQLRTENADWRTKVRALEGQVREQGIGTELTRRGIQADPSWIKVADGQSTADAVEAFAQKYPNLVPAEADGGDPAPAADGTETRNVGGETPPAKPKAPGDLGPQNKGTGGEKGNALGKLTVDEIKANPVARGKLAAHYQNLIQQDGNQGG